MTTSPHRRSLRALVAGLILPLLFVANQGAAIDWTHTTGSSSWFTNANWAGGTPPSAADDATIGSNGNTSTAVVDGGTNAATAANLYINGGGVKVGGTFPGTLNVQGQINVGYENSANLAVGDRSILSANTLDVGPSGHYSDTNTSKLILTGSNPTIQMADSIIVNSQVQGTNGLNKNGLGSLTLANNNSYTGPTTVTLGTLHVGNAGATGSLGDGDVSVATDATLAFNRSDASGYVVTNLISGDGRLVQEGSGRTILAADNTYTGGTTITAGTLQIGNGGTNGSLSTGMVTNNGTLAYDRSDDLELTNLISGSGSLRQMGGGTLTITADNTFSGGTTISNGAVQVGNGGTNGSIGTGNVNNQRALIFNRSDDITIVNQISGTGSVTYASSNITTLTGNSTYSGTTSIATNGTLQVGDGGTTGSLGSGGAVTNNGALAFDRGDSITVDNLITGTGSVAQISTNTLVLTGDNTYSGKTTITNGTLQVGDGGKHGSLGSGDVINDHALVFDRSDSIVTSNAISGSGTVRQTGGGTNTLTADNTYSGGTTVDSGSVLRIGDGGTTGSLGSGAVTNNGAVEYNRSDDAEVGNAISGSGSLAQNGTNTLTLTGDNSYGKTSIGTNGTLQVGNGGTTGSLGTGSVTNSGAMVFNRSDSIVVSNSVSGGGTLAQIGTGTMTVTADNTYTGTTSITNGTLQVGDGGSTGSLGTNSILNYFALVFNRSNSFTLDNVMSGTGTLTLTGTSNTIVTLTATNTYSGGTTVSSNATLVVGNNQALGNGGLTLADGTLKTVATSATNKLNINIGGDFTMSTNSTLQLNVASTVSNSSTNGSSTNGYDHLTVAGVAHLGGTLIYEGADGYVPHHNDQWVVLTADRGVTNEFDANSSFTNKSGISALLTPTLIYSSSNVISAFDHRSYVDFLVTSNDVKLTHNQLAVGHALDSITNSTASNDVALIDDLDYLGNLTNNLPAAFDLVGPEQLTSMEVAAFAVMEAQGNQFLTRARDLRSNYRGLYTEETRKRAPLGASLSPDFDQLVNKPWDIYLELPINSASVKKDGNAAGYDISSAGFTLGTDGQLGQNWVVGGALNYAGSSADLVNSGKMDMTTLGVQAYTTWFKKGLHLEAMIGGDFNSYTTKRTSVADTNGVATAKGSTDGFAWTGLVGGGYDWENGPWKFGPSLELQYMSASINQFTEKGSQAPLRILSQSEDSAFTQLGMNFRYRHIFEDSWTILTPEVYFGWNHYLSGTSTSVKSQFASGEGDTFTVNGPALGSDSIVASLGFAIQWQPSFNTYFNFTTQMGRSGYDSSTINFGARLSF